MIICRKLKGPLPKNLLSNLAYTTGLSETNSCLLQVFTNATPEHWCAPPPELQVLALPDQLTRSLMVPGEHGSYESCRAYTLDPRALYAVLDDYVDERLVLDVTFLHLTSRILRLCRQWVLTFLSRCITEDQHHHWSPLLLFLTIIKYNVLKILYAVNCLCFIKCIRP